MLKQRIQYDDEFKKIRYSETLPLGVPIFKRKSPQNEFYTLKDCYQIPL